MSRRILAVMATAVLMVVLAIMGAAQSNPVQDGAATAQKGKNQKGKNQNKKNQKGKKAVGNRTNRTRVAGHVSDLINTASAGGAYVLSTGDSFDDFASVAEANDGTVYVAYAAYYDGHDQIRLHKRLADGQWTSRNYVPLVRAQADIWMPQLAVDAQGRLWVIWAEQTGQRPDKTGNWDLYARSLVNDDIWGPIQRLTTDRKPDINPHVTTDTDRNIHVVWQAHPENSGDLQYCRFDGNEWSKPLAVTSDSESDWYPRVAVDREGTAWIAFDSYRNGDYDVFLTSVSGGKLGKVIPIATSTYYEAHATVACTPDDRVWVGWEQGGHNWGKDQGYWLRRENRNQGTTLGSTRKVKVACWHDDKVWAAPDVTAVLPQGQRQRPTGSATLAAGTDGRLWLRFRHIVQGRQRARNRFTRGWTEVVTSLNKEGWSETQTLPASAGRISVFSRIQPSNDGSLHFAYSADARAVQNFHRPIQDNVIYKRIAAPTEDPGVPELAAYTAPDPPAIVAPWNSGQEARQVAAIRDYRATIGGTPHRIVRGDLHRHTELSWDVGPGNDGSYLDFYRYMIDVASMDFGALTDHQGGGHYAYWWWLTEKSADMYYIEPRFVPLYGYERSARFPNGHRNIFHSYRGVPVFPFQTKPTRAGAFPGVGTGNLVQNDTKLLYEYLHASGGIAISHTSGTSSMGTDWRDNDPEVEPVVEIYQGARNSYEAFGAPRVHSRDEPPARAPGGFQEEGLMWNAYMKGYRLGTTASSDHGSTHISFSMVYTPKNDRAEIIESIRKRQTYGATDNLIVEFRANGHFQGEEFDTNQKPSLSLKVTGTGRIARIDLVRNNEYIYNVEPGEAAYELKQYVDMEPEAGTNLYYFRILQASGEVAWSSPIWINYKK